jgi:putative salt-induced outer membrane protein YdiY
MTRPAHSLMRPALLVLAVLAAPLVRAQDAAPKDSVKPLTATANLGLAIASGNASVTTVTAGDQVTYKTGMWKFSQLFSLIYGKHDSVETANQWAFGLRADYTLSTRWALYAGARFDRNPFAGYDQRWGENVGAIWNAVVAPKDKLDLEAGLGLTQQRSTDGTNDDYPNGRGAAIYRHSWTEKTYFQETAEALPDLKHSQNLRVNSLAELVAPISAAIGMRLAYLVQYDRQPEPGFKTTDQTLTAGLQFSY